MSRAVETGGAHVRIVIVSQFFPPDAGPGAVRPYALATALHRLGVEVTVVTARSDPSPAPFRVVSIPYVGFGRQVKRAMAVDASADLGRVAEGRGPLAVRFTSWAARNVERVFQHPDKYRAWIPAVRRWVHTPEGAALRPDIVIATSPPVSAAVAGADLAAALRVPLVLEFRDLWTENPYYRFGPLRRAFDRLSERRLIRRARALVTATAPYAALLEATVPGSDIRVIRTGVLLEPSARQPEGRRKPGTMDIGHFGSMEDWVRRDPLPILRAARRLVAKGTVPAGAIRFHFFGRYGQRFLAELEDSGVRDLVELHGSVPHDVATAEMAASDAALLLMWPGDTQSVPMKATEYMSLGKTVIVSGAAGDSEIRRVLGDSADVYFCDDDVSAEDALMTCWRRFSDEGTLDASDLRRAEPFLASTMARGFLALAEEITRRA